MGKKNDPLAVPKDLAAGTAAGVAQTLVGHPFDTVKVRLQSAKPGLYSSAMDAVRKTIAREGYGGLYKGVTSPLAGAGAINAVLFLANAQCRNLITGGDDSVVLTPSQALACGVGAGIANSFVSSPVEMVKCKLQVQTANLAPGEKPLYKGTFDAARQLARAHGLRGLFQGWTATVMREIPMYGAYFGTYEAMKQMMVPIGGSTKDLGPFHLLAAGGVGGIACWFACYPIDVIKSSIQVQPLTADTRLTTTIRGIMAQSGIKGFARGFTPCLARSFPANAVTFATYEIVRNAMD